jgi:heme-degrading monooxygenase HmoA
VVKLRLERLDREPAYTSGRLLVDEVFECWVLEDPVREGPKVHGETAIPEGTYAVLLTFSNRFQKVMPQIMDVPGFEGIRIHAGNTVEQTEGCLLVGNKRAGATIIDSRAAYKALFNKLQDAHDRQEPITIEVMHAEVA